MNKKEVDIVVLSIFVEISIIIVIVTLVAGIMKLLRQPLILGYIITGIILGPAVLNVIGSRDIIAGFSEIGIALLLFIVGLSLSPKVIKEVGKVSLLTGVGQVFLSFAFGFLISRLLGFTTLVSLYLAIAMTFGSTIIVMKLLSDKKELDTLHGKIATGVLIFQDIVAIIVLILISSFYDRSVFGSMVLSVIFKGVLLIGLLALISIYVLPRLGFFFAKSQEFLFLFSLAWGLGLATLFSVIGFSIEIGALIAGVLLSLSPYHYEISSKMRLLRDFFIILFFVLLGSQIVLQDVSKYLFPIIVFSLFVFLGHPLFVMIFTGLSNYNKRTGFLTGSALSQISEFSLIIVVLGVRLGHLSNSILSLVTVVGLITILASTYVTLYSHKIYFYLHEFLSIFERKKVKKSKRKRGYDILLFGYNRVGYDFIHSFKKLKKRFLVVDYNPEVIADLSKVGLDCEYGDADDVEFLDSLNLGKTKMVVSTIPDFDTNLLLIRMIRSKNKKTIIIVISHSIDEATDLYNEGATYVIMPHFLGGKYASMLIDRNGLNFNKFLDEKKKHIIHLKRRSSLGHHHPSIEKNK